MFKSRQQDSADAYQTYLGVLARAGGDQVRAKYLATQAVAQGANPVISRALPLGNDQKSLLGVRGPAASRATREAFEREVSFAKAAVAAGTTTDATWANPLVALAVIEESWLARQFNSALDSIAANPRSRPMLSGFRWKVTTAVAHGSTLGEIQYTPISTAGFDAGFATPRRAQSAVVVENDLLMMGGPQADEILASEVSRGASVAADAQVISILTAGLTPIAGDTDPRIDIRNLLAAVPMAQNSAPMLFFDPALIKQLGVFGSGNGPLLFPDIQVPDGGQIAGIPCAALDALSGGQIVLVDVSQVGVDPGLLEIDASSSTSIVMTDNPSAPAAATSMFQTNSTAIRSTRWFSLTRIRADAVAAITGADYTPGGGPGGSP